MILRNTLLAFLVAGVSSSSYNNIIIDKVNDPVDKMPHASQRNTLVRARYIIGRKSRISPAKLDHEVASFDRIEKILLRATIREDFHTYLVNDEDIYTSPRANVG